MLNSKIKKFAQENGLTVAHGVAYGYFNDYLLTLSQDSGDVTAVFAVTVPNEIYVGAIKDGLVDRDFKTEHLIRFVQADSIKVTVDFAGSAGAVVKKLSCALTAITEILRECGALGKGYCPYCRQPVSGTEEMYLINGMAMQLHSGCLESLKSDFSERTEAAKTSGSVLTGTVGAALGAIVGAIPWAVASFLGWVVAYLGFVISLASCKGYELLHGKETRVKGIIVLIMSVLAVVLAEYVTMLVMLMREYPGTPLSTCITGLNTVIMYDKEVQAELIKNLVIGWLFAVLGMYPIIKSIFTNVKQTSGEIIKL